MSVIEVLRHAQASVKTAIVEVAIEVPLLMVAWIPGTLVFGTIKAPNASLILRLAVLHPTTVEMIAKQPLVIQVPTSL